MQWDIAIGMDSTMSESFQFILHLYSTICVKPPPYRSYTKHKTGWLAKSDICIVSLFAKCCSIVACITELDEEEAGDQS